MAIASSNLFNRIEHLERQQLVIKNFITRLANELDNLNLQYSQTENIVDEIEDKVEAIASGWH
jgi:archaellum component FlaC